jgi:isopentenyl diphosphate isomerase/L-lactate dehydrogenase-like FMN-dependent dehydrogenase/biotin carboxylase
MIIGGGVLQVPAIQTASSMGIKTIVTDYNPEAYGLKIADYPVVMSTRDVDGTVRVARELSRKIPIDGVMTVGTDASKTVAAVANTLGLPGIRFEDAECATNKIKMRSRFREHKVPCPDFYGVWSYNEAVESFRKLSKPVVIKPADNMGARGVRRIDREEDLSPAFEEAKRNSPSGEIILEEYMEGDELSIDALVYNGEVYVCGIADRIIERAPFFVETGHVMPSRKSPEVLADAVEVMKQGIKALGISVGAAKGDIKVTAKGAKIVELAARLSGGFMSTYTFPYSSGINLMKAAIKIMLGEKPDEEMFSPKWSKVAIERAIIPQPGVIKEIRGLEEAEKVPGVRNIFITREIGDDVVSPKNNVEKVGHIIVVADHHDKAFELSGKALESIQVITEARTDLTLEEVRKRAIEKFNRACFVCSDCNGNECRGKVPGMGSVGKGYTFSNNIQSIRKYRVIPRYLHEVKKLDMRVPFLNFDLELPLIIAPVTGARTNMGGNIEEKAFLLDTLRGAQKAGIVAMLGDGASPEKYRMGAEAIEEASGYGIQIFKPRENEEESLKRIRRAESAGALAVGMDIDAATFLTMKLKGQTVEPKTLNKLKRIIGSTRLPFIVKGIMSVQDAKLAVRAGASFLYISNHGGRVMDYMPGTLEVLPEIRKAVGKRPKIIVDGGFREGIDILKGLAMGADYIAIGRPAAIAVVGGGETGLALQIEQWKQELNEAMILTGVSRIKDIGAKLVRKERT